MFWTDRINRVAGVTLLLFALGIILSTVFFLGISDANPFDRDEVEELLRDIHDDRELAILATVFDVAVDSVLAIAAAAMLYLVFRERNRLLAFFGLVFLLAQSVAFMASDGAAVASIVIADDFAEGGPGGIAAGDNVTLQVGHALVIVTTIIDQIAFTSLAFGLIAIGTLIAWTPTRGGVAPPAWMGWLAVLSGAALIAGWLAVLTEGGFVLTAIGIIASLIFLIALGVWLLREPEAGEARPAPSPAPTAGGTPLQP